MNKITINKMVSKKLMGARKLHCLGVSFLAVTLSGSAERLQAAAVSKEEQSLSQPLVRKNVVAILKKERN